MRKHISGHTIIGFGIVACLVGVMFAAIRLPFMEVVRNNLRSRIDADAYFYSEVSGFSEYEKAVEGKRR